MYLLALTITRILKPPSCLQIHPPDFSAPPTNVCPPPSYPSTSQSLPVSSPLSFSIHGENCRDAAKWGVESSLPSSGCLWAPAGLRQPKKSVCGPSSSELQVLPPLEGQATGSLLEFPTPTLRSPDQDMHFRGRATIPSYLPPLGSTPEI